MKVPLKIDFVSDVSCPWCAVGLLSLEEALGRIEGIVAAEIHFQPFELNPQLLPEGQNLDEHLAWKYGSSSQQRDAIRETLRARGAELGFDFAWNPDSRIYNTFDAHRLLHWAGLEGRQKELKRALLEAYFTKSENPGAHEVLIRLAGEVGLDPVRTAEILSSDEYADEVRQSQRMYRKRGIDAVPAVIINDRHLIPGGQTPEVYEQVLRRLAGTRE